jgi:hypothetical protein
MSQIIRVGQFNAGDTSGENIANIGTLHTACIRIQGYDRSRFHEELKGIGLTINYESNFAFHFAEIAVGFKSRKKGNDIDKFPVSDITIFGNETFSDRKYLNDLIVQDITQKFNVFYGILDIPGRRLEKDNRFYISSLTWLENFYNAAENVVKAQHAAQAFVAEKYKQDSEILARAIRGS